MAQRRDGPAPRPIRPYHEHDNDPCDSMPTHNRTLERRSIEQPIAPTARLVHAYLARILLYLSRLASVSAFDLPACM